MSDGPSAEVPTQDQPLCCVCEIAVEPLSYCHGCDAYYCDGCWETQVPHRKKLSSHEKKQASIATKIKNAMMPPSAGEEEERMHKSDLQTAWFGVFRPEDSRPSFQLYGRLLELTSKSNQDSEQSNQTPGLVSFVGDTGAGKSSLIRLLIENQNRDSQPFQTPVVGSSTSIQPTSEDVHLYADPWTSSSDAPILYADCEGLLGGDRAPLAAALKQRLYRPMASTPITSSPIAGSPQSVDDDVNRRLIVYEREITWDTQHSSRQFAVKNLYPRLLYIFSDVVVFVVKNPR